MYLCVCVCERGAWHRVVAVAFVAPAADAHDAGWVQTIVWAPPPAYFSAAVSSFTLLVTVDLTSAILSDADATLSESISFSSILAEMP